MTSTPAIRLRALSKTFAGAERPAVTSLDLDVPDGAIVAFVGPSGCGKTTTLKMINRLVEPTSGEIDVLGQDNRTLPVHELRRNIGYVIQQIGLFPHKKVRDNIAAVPRLLDWPRHRIDDRVDELAGLVGLDAELLDRYPSGLSGGQQQRVGVARALAADPPILLMDEPYSAVDPIVRSRLQDELLALQASLHKTIVIVTHDIEEALRLGDRVALFTVGGILEQYAEPAELLTRPATPFVEEFLGAERGLRRLGLLTVADATIERGPRVSSHASGAEVEATMREHGTDWAAVVDDDTALGWIRSGDAHTLGTATPALQPFRASVSPTTPLREALDVIVQAENLTAAVVEGERFLGLLSIASVSDGLRDTGRTDP